MGTLEDQSFSVFNMVSILITQILVLITVGIQLVNKCLIHKWYFQLNGDLNSEQKFW